MILVNFVISLISHISLSLFGLSEEVHVSFTNWWIISDSDLSIVEVNPFFIFPDVANVVASVQTGAEMGDGAVEAIFTHIWIGILEQRFDFCCLGRLVNLHRLILITSRFIHVAHDPVTSSFQIVIALSECSLRLSLGEAEHLELFNLLSVNSWFATRGSRRILLGVRNPEWRLDDWVFDVHIEPFAGCVGTTWIVEDSMLGSNIWYSHLYELIDHIRIDFGLNFICFFYLRYSFFTWLQLAIISSQLFIIVNAISVHLKLDFQLLWNPIVIHNSFQDNDQSFRIRQEPFSFGVDSFHST